MNGFTFYNNYYEMIKYLKKEDRLEMYDAIFQFMFEDKEPTFNGIKKGLWINLSIPLNTSKTNSLNGKKGGAKEGNINAQKQAKNKRKTNEKQTNDKRIKNEKQTNNISIFLFLISNNKYIYINNNNIILINKIKEWLEYKEERKEIYKETGLKSLLKEIENNIEIYGIENVVELINTCMANNYKGIIFEKLKGKVKKENKYDGYIRIDYQ